MVSEKKFFYFFFYYKSNGANEPRGMIGRICVGGHLTLLHN